MAVTNWLLPDEPCAVLLVRGRGVIGTLIRWQTRSPYTHAAILVNGTVYEAREFRGVIATGRLWWCRDPGEVVDVAPLRLTAAQRAELAGWLQEQVGKGYDYGSVLRFISRRQEGRRGSGTWFCSELVFAGLRHVGVEVLVRIEPWAVSPGLLGVSPVLRIRARRWGFSASQCGRGPS